MNPPVVQRRVATPLYVRASSASRQCYQNTATKRSARRHAVASEREREKLSRSRQRTSFGLLFRFKGRSSMENSKCPKINNFCYVCGHMVLKKEEKELISLFSADFTKAYEHYFNETDSSGEDFTPNTVCKMCYNTLVNWIHKKGAQLPYVKPIIWIKDPTGHDVSRCYSCINFTQGMNRRKLKTKVYVPAFTAVLPLLRQKGDKLPKPPTPLSPHGSQRAETIFTNPTNVADVEWEPDFEDDGPQPLTQSEMDYIVARMGASQRNSEWLTSFLKSRKLTQQGVNATSYRKRQADFQTFYTVNDENTFAYCHDIPGLINKLGMEYNANDWRLFIDGSVSSLKAVLLHITNKKPSIPIGFGINKKETYETLGAILNKIKYEEQKWKICCDLKVVNILQGVIEKGGFPKYFCFLCYWDSRYRGNQYQCKDWILRTSDNQEQLRLHNEPMIQDIADILLPPLHIKLGISGKLIEVLVKDVNGAFECLKTIFPKLSNDKIRAGMFF
ncbi:unnamed protein product [Brassicogethes aeneus]|uniref:Uncharacterized protein n=1 Tax=Brassicogethes aeneus TaxID=1431903 RepID=A0A9P0B793_BRAAE|nr:unnamed protein product [Brassicogethes aeneus]